MVYYMVASWNAHEFRSGQIILLEADYKDL